MALAPRMAFSSPTPVQALAAGLLLLGALYVLVGFARLRRTLRALSELPTPPGSLLSGNLDLVQDLNHANHKLGRAANARGGICMARVLHYPFVVVTNPALVQRLLSSSLNLPKDPIIYGIFNGLTSPDCKPNLLGHSTQDGYWRLVRKGIAPAFSPRAIRAEFGHVLSLADQVAATLRNAGSGNYVDVDNLLQRQAIDVIARVGFGTDFGALRGFDAGGSAAIGSGDLFAEFKAAADEIVALWNRPIRFSLRKVLPSARRGQRALLAAQARMRGLLAEIRGRGPLPESDTSVAAHLLRIVDPTTGKPLTDEQLAGEMGLIFFAGFETTGHTMAWTLYLLAEHPEAEARVAAELDSLGLLATAARPEPRALVYDDLAKLRYLACVIKESMRRVPVVAGGTVRMPTRDISLGGYTIPAGVPIIASFVGTFNSEANFERPDDFLPERWEAGGAEYWAPPGGDARRRGSGSRDGGGGDGVLVEEEAWEDANSPPERPPKRFLPFSDGLRNCIGQNLARMNVTATLACLLGQLTFQLPEELKGPEALWALQANKITNQPLNGLPMRCIPRQA